MAYSKQIPSIEGFDSITTSLPYFSIKLYNLTACSCVFHFWIWHLLRDAIVTIASALSQRLLPNTPRSVPLIPRPLNTATTAFPAYASFCANSPSRVSSACSCVVTSPPSCTPSTVIQGPIRNGGFNTYAIPYGAASGPYSQPPWYHNRLTKVYGDFFNEEKSSGSSYYGYGAALAFSWIPALDHCTNIRS